MSFIKSRTPIRLIKLDGWGGGRKRERERQREREREREEIINGMQL